MPQQVFLPAVAEFPDDLQTSWELQKPLSKKGYIPGFMLVVRKADSPRVKDPENRKKQFGNLERYSEQYKDAAIVTMLPNFPIQDIDFLHNTSFATDHVLAGIDFAKSIPIGGRKILTFHLNSLVAQEEFYKKSQFGWREKFLRVIQPSLKSIGEESKSKGVDVLVESVPIPEFGDISQDDEREYRGEKLRNLLNPFYHFSGNFVDRGLREAGLGTCLDLCHSRTLYIQANTTGYGLHKGDIEGIFRGEDLVEEVSLLNDEDIVHLNDGKGQYTREGGVFYEGVALGQGDLPLKEILRVLRGSKTPMVLEINETDFKNRPNTKASIDYLLTH